MKNFALRQCGRFPMLFTLRVIYLYENQNFNLHVIVAHNLMAAYKMIVRICVTNILDETFPYCSMNVDDNLILNTVLV